MGYSAILDHRGLLLHLTNSTLISTARKATCWKSRVFNVICKSESIPFADLFYL